ncbi:helix-turn-helix domain-containing protein [Mycolicibacterium hippocampi]|uniref:Helix-turn-helix domain-containing protein n=1 Tax=Mycolicibacterium hippocampi TaxID=659824 RepID=A0A7I9ZQT3_9MYCO|nr:hypothetical protein MHIP_38730 [Mycolicibacterium hippocampi]
MARPAPPRSRPAPSAPPRLGTPAEAACEAHVHPNSVYRWIKSGHLRAWRVGPRLLRVDLDEVLKLVNGGDAP